MTLTDERIWECPVHREEVFLNVMFPVRGLSIPGVPELNAAAEYYRKFGSVALEYSDRVKKLLESTAEGVVY